MFQTNVRSSFGSVPAAVPPLQAQSPQQSPSAPGRLVLVSSGGGGVPQIQATSSTLVELIAISAHRCSAFFAEASVLVLVLALLDRFMAKGRIEISWFVCASGISLTLLAASIATDFTARRWLKAH